MLFHRTLSQSFWLSYQGMLSTVLQFDTFNILGQPDTDTTVITHRVCSFLDILQPTTLILYADNRIRHKQAETESLKTTARWTKE